jgi:hypothetical protein
MKNIFYICLVLGVMFSSVTFVSCGSDDGGKNNPENNTDRDAAGNIKITEVNFPDPVFRVYLFDKYGADGVLSDAEIDNVTELNVRSKGIKSLKGIEFFPLLKILDCCNNLITSLDVSKNTKLTDIFCYYNLLTSLDVSGCTKLTHLLCYDNHLASLNVSGCTELRSLRCHSNLITSLDVSKNIKLTDVLCNDNQLTSLDVSGCTELISLDCRSNLLTSLDVSKNTSLTKLDCDPSVTVIGWPK